MIRVDARDGLRDQLWQELCQDTAQSFRVNMYMAIRVARQLLRLRRELDDALGFPLGRR